MCGRYTLHTEKELLARRFGFDPEALAELAPRYNVAPTDEVVSVRVRHGEQEAVRMRWGLVPSWSKGPEASNASQRRSPLINARAETVAERPAYRRALRRRRCLMLADGFYEWQPPALERGPKLPHWIALPGGEPFAFAGLYEVWWPEGSDRSAQPPLLSCALVTTAATPDLAPIHARMPVILAREREAAWLDPKLDDSVDALLALLQAPQPGTLEARAVSRRVNTVANDGPELLLPSDAPETGFSLEG
jgi:putative SOS response-associated peptidase YedK